MCDIPVPIDDAENIVRAVFSNHLESKKLRWTFLNEPHDQASVMRHSYLGSDECKRHALEITPGDPKIRYKGMAVIRVSDIRSRGSEVYDSRDVFCGHAHVATNVAVPPADDPLYAESKFAREERLRALRALARYIPDPNPAEATWSGEEIQPTLAR
jgi:hypothetical protein